MDHTLGQFLIYPIHLTMQSGIPTRKYGSRKGIPCEVMYIRDIFDKNESRVRILQWYNLLTKEQCFLLCYMWLVALTMKDVSVMTSVKVIGTTAEDMNSPENNLIMSCKLQTNTECGLLLREIPPIHTDITTDNNRSTVLPKYNILAYNITMVDIELKPVTKIMDHIQEMNGQEAATLKDIPCPEFIY